MKRALKVAGIVLLVIVLGLAGLFMSIFGGNAALEDRDLLDGAHLVKDGYVAIGMVPAGDKKVVLFDCGNDPTGAAILKALSAKGMGPDAVQGIFLTHGHPDHIAACHLFPAVPVLSLGPDMPLASGAERAKGPLPSMMDTPAEKRVTVTRALADGEVVTFGSLNVKVYATPGHTGGSASYLANGMLFLGDNATGGSNGQLKAAPTIFTDDPAQNRGALVALAKRLVEEHAQVKMLVFAHSGPFEGMSALQAFSAN